MNTQINVRLPEKVLMSAQTYAEEHGFNSIQEFIKEAIREKLFEKPEISKEELALVRNLVEASEKNNLYGKKGFGDLTKKLRGRLEALRKETGEK